MWPPLVIKYFYCVVLQRSRNVFSTAPMKKLTHFCWDSWIRWCIHKRVSAYAYFNRSLKAAGNFVKKSATKIVNPTGFRKPLIWESAIFENSFILALSASKNPFSRIWAWEHWLIRNKMKSIIRWDRYWQVVLADPVLFWNGSGSGSDLLRWSAMDPDLDPTWKNISGFFQLPS